MGFNSDFKGLKLAKYYFVLQSAILYIVGQIPYLGSMLRSISVLFTTPCLRMVLLFKYYV